MSKVKVIVLSLLTVLAVSATATAFASAHQWLKNGAALTQTEAVLSSGGVFELVSASVNITCQTVADTGVVLIGTMDEATSIHFLNCTTNKAGCDVSSVGATRGLIQVSNILTELALKENANKETIVADEFKENAANKAFVTLLFTSLTAGACNPIPEQVKIIGHISAEINNTTEELIFPEHEVKGNTLEFSNGVAAKLKGSDKQMLTSGGSLTAD